MPSAPRSSRQTPRRAVRPRELRSRELSAAEQGIFPQTHAKRSASSPKTLLTQRLTNQMRRLDRGIGSGIGCSFPVRVDDPGDDPGQDLAHLPLVAPHQYRVLKRLLRHLTQFGEVLVQHL